MTKKSKAKRKQRKARTWWTYMGTDGFCGRLRTKEETLAVREFAIKYGAPWRAPYVLLKVREVLE